jgi:hypothetical protein
VSEAPPRPDKRGIDPGTPRGNSLIMAVLIGALVGAGFATDWGSSLGTDSSENSNETYEAPSGPGADVYYGAIQFQYDRGDCGGLDAIIGGWREDHSVDPYDPDSPDDPNWSDYIAEAERAKRILGCGGGK